MKVTKSKDTFDHVHIMTGGGGGGGGGRLQAATTDDSQSLSHNTHCDNPTHRRIYYLLQRLEY